MIDDPRPGLPLTHAWWKGRSGPGGARRSTVSSQPGYPCHCWKSASASGWLMRCSQQVVSNRSNCISTKGSLARPPSILRLPRTQR